MSVLSNCVDGTRDQAVRKKRVYKEARMSKCIHVHCINQLTLSDVLFSLILFKINLGSDGSVSSTGMNSMKRCIGLHTRGRTKERGGAQRIRPHIPCVHFYHNQNHTGFNIHCATSPQSAHKSTFQ